MIWKITMITEKNVSMKFLTTGQEFSYRILTNIINIIQSNEWTILMSSQASFDSYEVMNEYEVTDFASLRLIQQ